MKRYKWLKNTNSILNQKALNDFLKFTNYTINKFGEIIEKFWNREIFENKDGLWILKHPIEKA